MIGPLVVDTSRVSPITERKLLDSDCSHCGKARARWFFQPDEVEEGALFICSICWLFESNWGRNRKDEVEALIKETEDYMRCVFVRDDEGRLTERDSADRIMGAICYMSRMLEMRGLLEQKLRQ